jgi:hypothetical protein
MNLLKDGAHVNDGFATLNGGKRHQRTSDESRQNLSPSATGRDMMGGASLMKCSTCKTTRTAVENQVAGWKKQDHVQTLRKEGSLAVMPRQSVGCHELCQDELLLHC